MTKQLITKTSFLQKNSISQDIVIYIKGLIISGELNPGDRIVESKLARDLGISQTPVREALRQLQGEGIILIVPNKGPQVCDLTKKDVFEIYSIRSMLEGLAFRQATQSVNDRDIERLEGIYEEMKQKMDDPEVKDLLSHSARLHQMVVDLSKHSRIIEMYKSISFHVALINRILGTKSTKQKEVEQHLELIEAMKRRDPDYAEQTIRKHIYRSYTEYVEMNAPEEKAMDMDMKLWV